MRVRLRARLDKLLAGARLLVQDRVLMHRMSTSGRFQDRESPAMLPEPGRGANPDTWPETVPLPLTVRQAIEVASALTDDLADELARDIRAAVAELVKPKLQAAILARVDLTDRWPWPEGAPDRCPGWYAVAALQPFRREGAPSWVFQETRGDVSASVVRWPDYAWPGEAAPLEVAEWSRTPVNRLSPGLGDWQVEYVGHGGLPGAIGWRTEDGHRVCLPGAGLALVFLAERAVEADSRKPAMAWDAGRNHAEMVGAFALQPAQGSRGRRSLTRDGPRIELITPGRCVQLTLLDTDGLHAAVVETLRAVLGPNGVRHWFAFQNVLSEQGRTGCMRWTLDRHLEHMGYSAATRRRASFRAAAIAAVKLICGLELAVYDEGGQLRHRRRLLTVTEETDRRQGQRWELDAIDLEINRSIYSGVGSPRGLGSNWYPLPPALARINHQRFGPSLGIAAHLGTSLRLAWREDGRGHVDRTGRTLLERGAMTERFDPHNPGRTWEQLERNLGELVRVGLLDGWEWTRDPRTLDGVVRLPAADWLQDRTVRGVPVLEPPPAPRVFTGADLRDWRKGLGLTQADAAERLGVAERTVRAAEAKPDKSLSPKLRRVLRG